MEHQVKAPAPESCDTFVVLPPLTRDGSVIFGKNSDRPSGEVQEVVYFPDAVHETDVKLQCTFIEIDQVPKTFAVILSKPSWMWGAEMGANNHGVCIGNEAVWTKLNSGNDLEERLLGMDLVRLGLERGQSALEALNVITGLLDKYGQGGPCSDTLKNFSYHNSFLIVDRNEAWVLETAGHLWAAERITTGFRNISNCLSIGSKIDLASDDLRNKAKLLGFWNESESDCEFHFANVFRNDPIEGTGQARLDSWKQLLRNYSEGQRFDFESMMAILKDDSCGICRSNDHLFPTTSSQISILNTTDRPDAHWFTGTQNSKNSLYKPFVFLSDGHLRERFQLTMKTASPKMNDLEDPAKCIPRFQNTIDRMHYLWKSHETFVNNKNDVSGLAELQNNLVEKAKKVLSKKKNELTSQEWKDLSQLFNDSVDLELNIYSNSN